MRIAITVLTLSLLASPAPAAEVVLRTVAGKEAPAATLRLEGADLVAGGADGSLERVPLDTVIAVEVRGGKIPERVPEDILVRLIDGSEIAGTLLAGVEDQLALEVPGLGRLGIPIDAVSAAALGPPEARIDPALLATGEEKDIVYRRGPVEGDVLRGTLTRLGADGIAIDSDIGPVSLEAERVLGVAVAPLAVEHEPWAAHVELDLAAGGLLAGDLLALNAGQIQVRTLFSEALAVPLDLLARVRFASERFAYLGDLAPARVEEMPFFGGSEEFLFPWRRDRTVTGRPLVVGGERFAKGIGLHARARLSWSLETRYSRLQAVAGISDEVLDLGARGSVVFRVLVDGEARYDSGLVRGGEPARRLPDIDLRGARELTVEVDYGDEGDVADRAVLCDAILVRGD